MSRRGLPAIPVQLLPRPRLICWHGEIGDDPASDDALAVIRRTYYGVIGHGLIAGRTAGGNDWSGWHFPDGDAIAGLRVLVDAIAPAHWTVIAEPFADPALCPDCGHQHTTPDLGSICIGCDCLSLPAIVGPR